MPQSCDACGTTKHIHGSLGGAVLCKAHYQDILTEVEQLRAQDKQVNVMGIARRIYREINNTGNYILRDIPKDLLDAIKIKGAKTGQSMREIIIDAIQTYLTK